MTGPELSELDLAYAPPYSSAKDPVNMAGFMMENLAGGLLQQFHWDTIDTLPRDGSITLLDTRTAEEYGSGHARGFVNIPLDELRGRLTELCAGKPVYVMCQSGLRSYLACRIGAFPASISPAATGCTHRLKKSRRRRSRRCLAA